MKLPLILDFLLPRTCIVCGRRLNSSETHICLPCIGDMPYTRFFRTRCNAMSEQFNTLIQKDIESSTGFPAERYAYASALFFYRPESGYREITHQLKYHGNIAAGRYFGKILGHELAATERFKDVDIVIPVPLHRSRKRARGYNQAEIIAAEIAPQLGALLRCDILRRTRRTDTQTSLGIKEKAANVQDAFTATAPAETSGIRHILIVDDVFTTGSTVHACFCALRRIFPPSVRISVATLGFTAD